MQRLRQEFNLFVASLLESGLADVLSGLVAAVSLMVKGFFGRQIGGCLHLISNYSG